MIEGRPASERAGFDSNASAMRALNRSVDAIVIALFAATLALVNVQILCRFVLAVSVPWTEEVSRLLFIWLAHRTVNEYFMRTVFFDRELIFLGIVAGAVLGVLGSLVSVGRHLRNI